MTDDVNARLAKILGLPENTTRADIRIRPMFQPEIDITYFIDSNGLPEEVEEKFILVKLGGDENDG